jgi:CRISPR-associated protein Cmr4
MTEVAAALDTGLYTLTPTHCGTGQAAGAVDLPIARERHTGFPLLPSTSLKGVVRDLVEGFRGGARWPDKERQAFLGTDPPSEHGAEERLQAGFLVLTDARLLAFPVRSLQAPFLWVTCPLVVQRWERDRRALGLDVPGVSADLVPLPAAAGSALGDGSLVLEDQFHERVEWNDRGTGKLAEWWCRLLPGGERTTRDGLARKLVCVPDDDFQDLVRRTTPIQARVQLTGGKTTDTWTNPDTGAKESGNLWYEETLPSDCLFSVLATSRRRSLDDVASLRGLLTAPAHTVVQVGGNETVGHGLCWWRPEESGDAR